MTYKSYRELHLEIGQKLLDGGRPRSFIVDADDRLPLSLVGYSSNRWLRYLDNYLGGGVDFSFFLSGKFVKGKADTYFCNGNSRHTRGQCIISITVTSDMVHVNSRVMDWFGAGVLDLNLCWLLGHRLHRPVWVTCPLIKVTDWQLVGYKWLEELDSPLVDQAIKKRELPKEAFTFHRARRKLVALGIPQSSDEEEVICNFPRVTPEDIARHSGIKGVKLRDYLREANGLSTKGDDRKSHSWADYGDPRFVSMCRKLGIDARKLPPINQIASQRISP